MRLARRYALRRLLRLEALAGPGIERRAVGIARPGRARRRLLRGNAPGNVAARAEARIDEPRESGARRRIGGEMLGLPAHRRLPPEPEPGEILVDGGLEFGAAAGEVDVFDAQQEAARMGPRQRLVEQRREGVPEMQEAVGARREAEDGRHAG